MWSDDGDYDSFMHRDDADAWDQLRDQKIDKVRRLVDFLFKLGILHRGATEKWDSWHGFDLKGFVDRNWKV